MVAGSQDSHGPIQKRGGGLGGAEAPLGKSQVAIGFFRNIGKESPRETI